jgi:hypothetical protein
MDGTATVRNLYRHGGICMRLRIDAELWGGSDSNRQPDGFAARD